MKELFDRKARERNLKKGDLVLRWDTRREIKASIQNLTTSGLVHLTLQKSKGTIYSSYRIWKGSIPHCPSMGNT